LFFHIGHPLNPSQILIATVRLLIFFILLSEIIFAEVVINQCFVSFKEKLSIKAKEEIEKKYKLTKLKDFILTRASLYETTSTLPIEEIISLLRQEDTVLFADFNHIQHTQSIGLNEPRLGEQWYLDNLGKPVNFRQTKQGSDIGWTEAMSRYSPRQQRVVVSVIDTGISADHPEIKDRRAYMPAELDGIQGVDDDGLGYVDDKYGWDFIGNDNDPSDLNGHGTQVAGILAAHSKNELGISGIAPNAVILPMRVFNEYGGGATDDRILSALGYSILGGVRIINLSLGKGSAFSIPIQDALYNLEKNFDVLLICAAGNGGEDGRGDNLETTPFYPASYLGNVILSVAATDENDELAIFSNFGKETVDLAAPGVNMLTPDLSRKTLQVENFEDDLSGWQFSSTMQGVEWERLTDQNGNRWLTDSAYDEYGYLADYGNNVSSSLQSPTIDLSGTKGTTLKVRIYHDLASSFLFFSYDTLWIEVFSNETSSWSTIGQVYGRSKRGGSLYQFDLSSFDGQTIRLRFRLETDSFRTADGVYLDDLEISGVSSFEKGLEQYAFVSGTSFAAPVVSGVAAMVLSHRPEISTKQLRDILLTTVREVEGLSEKVLSGGIISANAALTKADKTKVFLDEGWHYHREKWVYSSADNKWHYLATDPGQIFNWKNAQGGSSWEELDSSELEGWKYHIWPFLFNPSSDSWEYLRSETMWLGWKGDNQKWHFFDQELNSWRWIEE